jgi:hypothetical protein
MSLIFTDAFGGGLAAFWYHFAIMFEALFILTAVDAGTRVGRFMLQDTIGNVWPRYADLSWKPASWSASAVVVGLWGYMLYVGVTDPLGGINQLFPLFGISNQLLAAIALCLCVTLMFKHGKAKWVWVPGIALAWDLTTTMTASWQKVFSGDPKIGYFEQRSVYQSALDDGKLLPPATTTDQMHQVITNSTTNGVLQALFALLTLIVVASAIPVWVKAAKRACRPPRPPTSPRGWSPPPTSSPPRRRRQRCASTRSRSVSSPAPEDDDADRCAQSRSRDALVPQAADRRGQVGRLPRSLPQRTPAAGVAPGVRTPPGRAQREHRRVSLLLTPRPQSLLP